MQNSKCLDIHVKKNPELILAPDFIKNTSIRNPGAFTYNRKIGLLSTVRHMDNKSLLHLAWSNDGENFELEDKPFIELDNDSILGIEDARVSKIEDEYFITFTNYKETDNKSYNVTRIGLAKTKNFKDIFERRIILDKYGDNKDCVVFKKDNVPDFYVVHRPFYGIKNERAFAKIEKTRDFDIYQDLGDFLLPSENSWDNARVGINTPPIKIFHPEFGESFFSIYHGAAIKKNIYSMGYIVMDIDNPQTILERSKEPLLTPELNWEIGKGNYSAEVSNVVFGCGAIIINKNVLRIYYAGADRYTSFADLTFKNAKIQPKLL